MVEIASARKRCPVCNELKQVHDFGPNRVRPDGRQALCRECQREATRKSDRKHRSRKDQERRRYPFEEAAREKLRNAVKSGQIVKPHRCERCATQGQLHGHHHDYGKPLEVEWLCPTCHRATHPTRADALDRLIENLEAAEAERDRLREAIEFIARWAWRTEPPNANNNLTDRERLSAIKYYPVIKKAAAPHIELAEREAAALQKEPQP